MSDLKGRLSASLSGDYSLERELGGGGMSRVFVAEETALGRRVVVKVLSPETAEGLSAERFIREIKVAARLQQANIVPVLRAGELDGLPYYTMPFITGESLRFRMRTSIPMSEAIAVLRDVAKALAYAHGEGVVHRDIKPENVLLSSGTAVVTDFGIAKAISASREGRDGHLTALTGMGTSLGTPAYMAPEQSAGDPTTDARADLYAWGVVAYELLSGRHPFAQHSAVHALMRAHMTEVPEHLAVRSTGVPMTVSNIVMRCLAKSPDERPATAQELLDALEPHADAAGQTVAIRPPLGVGKALAIYATVFVVVALVTKASITLIGLPQWVFPVSIGVMALGLPVVLLTALIERQRTTHVTITPSSMSTLARIAHQHPSRFTWKRTSVGGVIAFGIFAILVVAYMGMRQFGIGPFGSLIGSKALGVRDRILVADMRGPAADTALGGALVEGLRAGLSESKALRLVSAENVGLVLQKMQKPGAPVVGDVAREVAERAGAKAILDGEVRSVGSTYALTVRLLPASGGEPLVTLQETAKNDEDFTPATGRLAKKLRARIGESLRSVNSAPELANVTTGSLPALRRYSEARRARDNGEYLRGIKLANEAVAIDSGFVAAHMLAGSILAGVSGMRQTQSEAIARAYQNRMRATPLERLQVEVIYWLTGPSPDLAKGEAAAQQALAIDPDIAGGFTGISALYQRDYARAAQLNSRALQLDSADLGQFYGLALAQAELGQIDSVRATLQHLSALAPGHPIAMVIGAQLAVLIGDDSSAMATATTMESMKAINPLYFEWGAMIREALLQRAGRFREAHLAYNQALNVRAQRGVVGERGIPLMMLAGERADYIGDIQGGQRLLDSALRLAPIAQSPPRQRPYLEIGQAAIAAGRLDLARSALDGLRRDDPQSLGVSNRPILPHLEGVLARAEGRYADAIAALRRANVGGGSREIPVELALTFDRAGQKDSAVVYFERFLNSTSLDLMLWVESNHLARARKRLGELYEERGDRDKAYGMYSLFVRQWQKADPEFQPVVQTVRDRMRALNKAGVGGL